MESTTRDEFEDPFKFGTGGTINQKIVDSYKADGFVVFPSVLDQSFVEKLNDRLEEILRGRYDRGRKPDKSPKLVKGELRTTTSGQGEVELKQKGKVGPLGFSGNLQNVKVLQVINVHKCDRLFRSTATSTSLGRIVAELTGWKEGVRLGQDQIWAKPPGAAPLAFHRDSPYFMFDPPDVVTVWIALDDMDEEIGPLEYVKGSHKWGEGRVGSANQFFQSDGGHALLHSAAERESIPLEAIEIESMAGLKAGGLSIHDGRTWHGSRKNQSSRRPRRGLGLHFVPSPVHFTKEASKSRLWKGYVDGIEDVSQLELPEEDFPVVWDPAIRQQHRVASN